MKWNILSIMTCKFNDLHACYMCECINKVMWEVPYFILGEYVAFVDASLTRHYEVET